MIGRSRIAAATLALAVLAAGAGCSGDEPEPKPTAAPTPEGPVLLSFAVYGPPPVVTAYAKIAADFSAANPGIVVNVRPYATHDEAIKAFDTAADVQGDQPDAFLASLSDLPRLMREDSVEKLDELLGERHVDFGDGYQRDSLEAFSADNALQCMPVDVSPLVVYLNTALVDLPALSETLNKTVDADTGWKLDTFAEAARAASVGNAKGVYIAPDLTQVGPFIWSGGGHLVNSLDEPTTLTLSDSSSEKALEKLLEIVRDPALTYNQQQLNRRSALQRFKAGKLGMMLGFRSLTPELRNQTGLDFDVMPLPKVGAKATSGESNGLCLAKSSEHPEETADFLAYAVSEEAMTQLAATGYVVPTNLDVVNSESFLQSDQFPASARVFSAGIRSIHSFPTADTWPSVAASTANLLRGLFYDPVIDPLDGRLKAIDAASAPLFTPVPTPSATVSPTTPTTVAPTAKASPSAG